MPNWAENISAGLKPTPATSLKKILIKKENIGKIKDIKLGRRGVGGRLRSITIVGRRKI